MNTTRTPLLSIPFNLREGAGNGPTTSWNTYDGQVQYAVVMVGESFHFLRRAFRTEVEASAWMATKACARTQAAYDFTEAYVTTRSN